MEEGKKSEGNEEKVKKSDDREYGLYLSVLATGRKRRIDSEPKG